MKFKFVVMSVVPMALSCVVERDEELGTQEQEVINGTPDSGHLASGRVGGCSATLIGKRTALTAAHCLDGPTQQVTFWTTHNGAAMTGTAIRSPFYGEFVNDVAVIKLDGDFFAYSGVAPARPVASAPWEGQWITVVGHGCTIWQTNVGVGTKRSGPAHIDDVESFKFQFDGSGGEARICHGDSGGASYSAHDGVVGVHSHRQGWLSGSDDVDMRVDKYLPWIRSVANDPTILNYGTTVCGDGICHVGEMCVQDGCAPPPEPYCGNWVCDPGEDEWSCYADCFRCYCDESTGFCSDGYTPCF